MDPEGSQRIGSRVAQSTSPEGSQNCAFLCCYLASSGEDGSRAARAAAVVVEVLGQIHGVGIFLSEIDFGIFDAVGRAAGCGAVFFEVGREVYGVGHLGSPVLVDILGLPFWCLDAVVVDRGFVTVAGVW